MTVKSTECKFEPVKLAYLMSALVRDTRSRTEYDKLMCERSALDRLVSLSKLCEMSMPERFALKRFACSKITPTSFVPVRSR